MTIGILILETDFPRLRGDIGNPDSFASNVIYGRVAGASVSAVVSGEPVKGPLLEMFVAEAQSLQQQGANVIGTSCGFLGAVQADIQQAISVPFLASSLSLVPLLRTAFGQDTRIAVLTFDAENLGAEHFGGTLDGNISVHGLPSDCYWRGVIAGNQPEVDTDKAQADVMALVARAMQEPERPDLLLIECTNLSPWKDKIKLETGLPVFDLVDTLEWLHMASYSAGD